MRGHSLLFVFVASVICCPVTDADWIGKTQVYYTIDKAREALFKDSGKVQESRIELDEKAAIAIETRLKEKLASREITFYEGEKNGRSTGYALVLEEIGKFRPITFMIRISPEGKFENAVVMVYRECRGSEIRSKRFIRQFRGKRSVHPIRINKDVINITGATMSVMAMTKVVRRALVLVEEAILEKQNGPS